MNSKILHHTLAPLFFLLTACGTAYHPTTDYGGIPGGGYSSTRINANTVIVNYDANIFTSSQTVNNYLLYRAAKITMESGYDYFVVVSTSTCPVNIHLQTTTTQHQTQPPKLFDQYYQTTQYQSYQASNTGFPCAAATAENASHESHAVIKMFTGKIPADLPRAYSPYDIFAHLGTGTSAITNGDMTQ